MGRRRAKSKKVSHDSSSSSSDDESSDDEAIPGGEKKKKNGKAVIAAVVLDASTDIARRPRNVGNCVSDFECARGVQEEEDSVPDDDLSFARQAPFCCAVCHCPEKIVQKLNLADEANFQPGEGACWHRRCCHGHHLDCKKGVLEYWSTPFLAAQEENFEYILKSTVDQEVEDEKRRATGESLRPSPAPDARNGNEPNTYPLHMEWITKRELVKQYSVARRQQAKLYNDDGWENPMDKLCTNESYIPGIVDPFEKYVQQMQAGSRSKARKGQDGIVVLDCFAGIGTAIVVLKKLGIKIQKVIHCEHDKISTHVYRHNHDREYNSELPEDDGIQHVYYSTFEELESNEQLLLDEHGPIDLIVGGPPCIDYSAVNARRQGVDGEQGSYMLRFGRFIRKLERLQGEGKLFFLVENVVLTGEDLENVCDAFGLEWDPIEFDSQYFSPTRRRRHFLTNIPLELNDFDFEGSLSHVTPSTCLEEGLVLPGQVLDEDMSIAKAACFMASSSRIDERGSLRMYVFHKESQPVKLTRNGKPEVCYYGRPINITERELMMGYPANYVKAPVFGLFHTLLEMGHCKEGRWKTHLDEKLHSFAGNYHKLTATDPYRFASHEGNIIMQMAPPQTTMKPYFYDAEEYSKHLVGLAYSVPVAELLLAPLKRAFVQRSYVGYGYRYPWETAQVDDGKEDARSCLQAMASTCTNGKEDSTSYSQEPLPPANSDDGPNGDEEGVAGTPKGHCVAPMPVNGNTVAARDSINTDDQMMSMATEIHRKPAPNNEPPCFGSSGSSHAHDSRNNGNHAVNDSRKRRLAEHDETHKKTQDASQHSTAPNVDAPIPKKSWKTTQPCRPSNR